jgi:acyl-ACP thioesterase
VSRKSYSFYIQPKDVDFQYQVTPASLTNILLAAAGKNADDNGFGLRDLNSMDHSWVLLSLAVEMDLFPLQYETIHVETWVEEVRRATTIRNFQISNQNNEPIGKACSIWAMIDLKTRRAKDLLALDGIHAHATGETLPMEKPIRLEAVEGQCYDSFKAKYSHIDINNHVSTIHYVEWICNYFTIKQFQQKNIARFEINFINEIVFGDEVRIFAVEFKKDDFHFEIRKDEKVACRARIKFNEDITTGETTPQGSQIR